MFIIRHALKNLGRNKGRSFLTGLLLVIILTCVTAALMIRDGAGKWAADYREKFGVEAGIETDWEYAGAHTEIKERVLEDGSVEGYSVFEAEPLSMEQLEAYADSEYLQRTAFSASARYTSKSLKPIELGENMVRLDGMSLEELYEFFGAKTEDDLYSQISKKDVEDIISSKKECFGNLYGYSDPACIREFARGKKKIKDGRFFENKGEVVIGEEFAEKNSLKVGDKIRVMGGKKTDNTEKELTVVGIFTDFYAQANQADVWIGFDKNDILVGYDTFRDLGFGGISPFLDEIKFFIRNPEVASSFEQELRAKGLPLSYKLNYDVSEYEKIVNPVMKIRSFAERIGASILLVGALLLMILTLIGIRDRKYEIGVLRAIGMPKWQVALGLVTEVALLVGFSCIVGFASGGVITKLALKLLLPENAELAGSISLTLMQTLPVFAAALMLALLTGALSTVAVTRYEPMKIFRHAQE